MIVTEMIALSKIKSKIYIDEEFAFVLYKGELRIYDVVQGEEISEANYNSIMTEVLPKRARKRSLFLLKDREYTEWQLKRKLEQSYYPKEVIQNAITYVKSYQYIDDMRYCKNYINYYLESKSKKIITLNLYKKGIQAEVMKECFELLEEEGIVENQWPLIQKELHKKHYDKDNTTSKEQQKLKASLYRKGFSIELINTALKE